MASTYNPSSLSTGWSEQGRARPAKQQEGRCADHQPLGTQEGGGWLHECGTGIPQNAQLENREWGWRDSLPTTPSSPAKTLTLIGSRNDGYRAHGCT